MALQPSTPEGFRGRETPPERDSEWEDDAQALLGNISKRKRDVAEWPRIGVVGRDWRKNSHCNIWSG